MATIKVGFINRIVEKLRLLFVFTLHRGKASLIFEPLANQADDVNAPRVWCVVKRLILNVSTIIQHCLESVWNELQQIVADDYKRHAAWSHILLRARIDECIFLHRDRMRKNVRRSICNQWNTSHLR